jgi:hypothetical protein
MSKHAANLRQAETQPLDETRHPGRTSVGRLGFLISLDKVTTHPKSRQTTVPHAKAANWRLDTVQIIVKEWSP